MQWLIEEDPHRDRAVLLRPDSEYAMRVATGISTPSENKQLAKRAHALYCTLLRDRRGRVGWAHAKGHSGHTWNDLADELAVRGSRSGEWGGCMPGERWRATRADGDLWRSWEGSGATWAYDTGLGRVAARDGYYDDGVKVKKNLLIPLIAEPFGGVTREVERLVDRLSKKKVADGTHYGKHSTWCDSRCGLTPLDPRDSRASARTTEL